MFSYKQQNVGKWMDAFVMGSSVKFGVLMASLVGDDSPIFFKWLVVVFSV